MRLSTLIGRNGKYRGVEIRGLALDSRKVRPGFLFAALPGEREHGGRFIPEALKNGAAAVLTSPGFNVRSAKAMVVEEENPRLAFSKAAARFFSPQPKTIAAVTGTNGKTSVAHFTRLMWEALGRKAASVGTLGVVAGGRTVETRLTTPDAVTFHQTLYRLARQGVNHAVVEASSHGLRQYRLDGAKIVIAAFTNLTRDHLDYHADEEDYFAAKARLFAEVLDAKGTAVVNVENPFGRRVLDLVKQRHIKAITIGGKSADLELIATERTPAGQDITFNYKGKRHAAYLPVIGAFQAANALLAAGIVIASGANAERVFKMISKLTSVPGRMELAGKTSSGAEVYIDYAHTPDGLINALKAGRTLATGSLHLVFGCGGERDPGKRAKMGRIAADLADSVIVTDDNPRGEPPAKIRAAILNACPGAKEIASRADAIAEAVSALRPGDVLLVTGKGHETGQIIGDQVIPFSDFAEVRKAIRAPGKGGGQ